MTMRHVTSTSIALGSESARAESDGTFTVTRKDDRVHALAANAADGIVTAWSAAASPVTALRFLGIYADPDDQLEGDPAVTVELTIDGVVVCFYVHKSIPLMLGSDTALWGGATITAIDGALSLVRIRNAETSALRVRVLAVGA